LRIIPSVALLKALLCILFPGASIRMNRVQRFYAILQLTQTTTIYSFTYVAL